AALVDLPLPVIAEVQGACAGFGLSLMLACDLAICSDESVFTLAYRNVGTTPDGGSTYHLPRLIGERRALELALLGHRIDGEEAARIGLVNRAVAASELHGTVSDWAARLAAGPTRILGRTKHLLRSSQDASLREQLEREAREFGASAITADFREGVAAFLEKRRPDFHDR
ncbi:MAG: enoyl-CoA hydratase-related protein, partial [Pirellulales bacterium]|nr:enoyl-CoA hydratase-related protein [Pirellulales bacterium]